MKTNPEAEIIHLRHEPLPVSCGITGRVRVTRVFREVTCQLCIDAEYERRCDNHDDDATCRVCDPADARWPAADTSKALAPGQTAYRAFGSLLVRIDRHHEGVSITVTYHPTLDRAFTNLDEGRRYVAFLREEVKAGKPVWAIEAAAGVLTSAAAVYDDAERDLIDSINSTMDDAQPKPVDVSDILGDAAKTGGWAGYRQSATTRPAVTSPPMDRILTTAVDGYVPRSRQATSTQLIALARRGLVELHYGRRRNQRVILGARLTDKAVKRVAA